MNRIKTRLDLDQAEVEEVLSGPWPGLEAFRPRVLSRILAAVGSQAHLDSVTADLARETAADPWLAGLAAGWEDLDREGRRAAWEEILTRLTRAAYATRPFCLRCGDCCRTGSPALLASEADLVRRGGPLEGRVYTIRAGEPILDPRRDRPDLAREELIKPLEPGGVCLFLSGNGCGIYDHRPAQCRVQACWEETGEKEAFKGPFLHRGLALAGEKRKLDYALAHQKRCPSRTLVPLAQAALGGDSTSLAGLEEMVAFDLHIRLFAVNQGHLGKEELDLVLGRPLAAILEPLGLVPWEIQGRIKLRQTT